VAFTGAAVTSKTGFAATGVATHDFWNTYDINSGPLSNLEFVDGTISGAGMTVANVDGAYGNGASDPMYSVYLFNGEGNITVTVSNLIAGTYNFYLYGHGNVDNQNSVFQLTAGSQNYRGEETTNGSGWLSSVWQEGVQYVEFPNINVAAGQTITITVAPGDGGYAVLSGLQMESGSTSFRPFIVIQPTNQAVRQGRTANFTVLAGGTLPLAYQWRFNNTRIPAATNSTYSLANAQQTNAGSYSVIVTNAYGSVTSAVAVLFVIAPVTNVIDVAFTYATVTSKTGFAATGVTTNDFWNTYNPNSGTLPSLAFVDGTATGAGMTVADVDGASGNGASDPMYASYLHTQGDITVTVTDLLEGTYDFYLYGHGNSNNQNSVFQLMVGTQSYGSEATTNGSGWLSPIWQEGVQYVVFPNISVAAGQTITITVAQGAGGYAILSGLQLVPSSFTHSSPFIVSQPVAQTEGQGATATFAVVAGGTVPLAYQWRFNNTPISAATNSTYSVTNAQPTNAGSYSVIVTNAYGSVQSVVAPLNVLLPASRLIDVAFTYATVTSKTGFAATGVTTNDFWNTYNPNSGTLPILAFVDGTAAGAGMTVADVGGAYGNGASDPMYGIYLYSLGADITVTVTNLVAGLYDFYLYGHGNHDIQNSVFQLMVGSQSCGTEATTNGSGWLSPVWQEGVQYVEFLSVSVSVGETVIITVEPGDNGDRILSGLQMASLSRSSSSAFIVTQPAGQTVVPGSTATFSVVAAGTTPFTYQWRFDNANISAATNSSYSVTNAQPTNDGNYSVIVTNAYGGVTSAVAALSVITPFDPVIDVAFMGPPVTGKTGFAATGVASNDFWNSYSTIATPGLLPNLKCVDGTASLSGLTLANGGGTYQNGASDPMYDNYVFTDTGNITVTVTNVMAGLYNFYLYGHGNEDIQNSIFQLTVGSQSYGSEATTNGSGWLSSIWQKGVQYVEFTNVIISAGQTITITVEPGASPYAVLAGLQMAPVLPPLIINASNQFVNASQLVVITNYAFSSNGPISFRLGSTAPAGASITTNGIFTWAPTCEQGSSTNLITVWAMDSGSPPLSNSMTFSVVVGDCVEVSVGSSVVQAGQETCAPVILISSVGLTNLSFTLGYLSGFLTNLNITPSNAVVASASANMVDPSHTQFNFGVQGGQMLQGSSVLGSICVDTLNGDSAFVTLAVVNMGVATPHNSAVTNLIGQGGRVVVVGRQPVLEASLGTNASRLLTLYGHSGASYGLLSATNLNGGGSWSAAGSVTLTNWFQVINLGGASNGMQFFQAVQR
jgi:hypothetical protein